MSSLFRQIVHANEGCNYRHEPLEFIANGGQQRTSTKLKLLNSFYTNKSKHTLYTSNKQSFLIDYLIRLPFVTVINSVLQDDHIQGFPAFYLFSLQRFMFHA